MTEAEKQVIKGVVYQLAVRATAKTFECQVGRDGERASAHAGGSGLTRLCVCVITAAGERHGVPGPEWGVEHHREGRAALPIELPWQEEREPGGDAQEGAEQGQEVAAACCLPRWCGAQSEAWALLL